ncbi:hypothetical protein B7463_g8944, partial [Scytalidium lignicola]
MQAHDPQDQPPPPPPQQQPPNFSPFFTLIHDPSTTSTIHPSRVHYLFSDDDASDLLTSACIRSLNPYHPPPSSLVPDSSQPPSLASSKHLASSTNSSSSSSRKVSRGQQHKSKKTTGAGAGGEREERVLIVDMNEAGDGVVSATSLSPEWQIVNAEVRNAPTWGGGDENSAEGEEEGEARKLMLRVEGVGVGAEEGVEGGGVGWRRGEKEREKEGEEGAIGEEEMLAIMESFDRKMAVLRKIVGQDVGLVGEAIGEEREQEQGQELIEENEKEERGDGKVEEAVEQKDVEEQKETDERTEG